MNEPAEPPETIAERLQVEPEAVASRAQTNLTQRYVEGATQWRSTRIAAVMVGVTLAYGALPLLSPVAAITGAPAWASLAFSGTMASLVVAATAAAQLRHPLHPSYRWLSLLEAVFWVVGSATLIALSGGVRSWYWSHLGVFVLGLSAVTYRQRLYAVTVGVSLAGLTLYFFVTHRMADGLIAACLGATIMLFQLGAARAGWRAEVAQARAELVAERAGEALARAERERIARDLHDGLGADLTALVWQAQSLEGDDEGQVRAVVERARASLAELRGAVFAARGEPMTARQLGQEMVRMARLGDGTGPPCRVTLEIDTDAELEAVRCRQLLRIAKEALLNARTHAEARHLELSLAITREITLVVRDDGRGFDPDVGRTGGLAHIRARATELGGQARWSTEVGRGTTFTLVAPVTPSPS